MNWSRTKLIFLIAFLVLDIFLGFQLYDKRKNADRTLPQTDESPKQTLQTAGIKWPANLPQIQVATYITGRAMSFAAKSTPSSNPPKKKGKKNGKTVTASNQQKSTMQSQLKPEIAQLQTGSNGVTQQFTLVDQGTSVVSQLSQPVTYPHPVTTHSMANFLTAFVYNGSQYQYWKQNKSDNAYIFVQTYQGRPVFSKNKGQSGALAVQTANGQITGYQQWYLDLKPYKNNKDTQPLSTPIEAIYTLYYDNDFPANSTVEMVELSYYNSIGNDFGKVKLFVPTWHIVVKEPHHKKLKEFFVNAITGDVQTLKQTSQNKG